MARLVELETVNPADAPLVLSVTSFLTVYFSVVGWVISAVSTGVELESTISTSVTEVSGVGGGPALRHELGHGDLLVMGGSCQRTWEHAVPKTTRATGPRISVQFRPRGVR